MTDLNSAVARVTARIVEKSKASRQRYLDLVAREGEGGVSRTQLSCGNLAHGFAASGDDKASIRTGGAMNPRDRRRTAPSATSPVRTGGRSCENARGAVCRTSE